MLLPLIVGPEDIAADPLPELKLLDCRKQEAYEGGHIPGAVHLDPALLNRVDKPVGGLLPDAEGVKALSQTIGLNAGDHVLAYDNGGESAAARCLWVLHAYGFFQTSWLNGGLKAWQTAGRDLSTDKIDVSNSNLELTFTPGNMLSVDQLLESDDYKNHVFVDARSANEFNGSDVRSARGGHAPGARHWEWTDVFDANGKLKDDDSLRAMVEQRQLTPNDQLVVYCQTHQRSAVSYLVLKHLGFDKVTAVDGAWSAWGNRSDTPIET